MRYSIKVPTRRGPVLDGVLFRDAEKQSDTVMIAITGIDHFFLLSPANLT